MSTHTATFENQAIFDSGGPEIFGLRSLIDETFQPMKWAVENLIPEGCVLFAGRPKLGKSWFVLQLALDVASGGKALGHVAVQQSDVLYLALEDTKRRLQSRAKHLLGASPLPDGLKMAVSWPRLDQGGDERLESWLNRNPQTKLVIIDTFQKIKSRQRGGDFESLSRLAQIAHKFGICLMIVHHARKAGAEDAFDTVSGPTETASLADAMLVMKRARCTPNAELHITGRDLEESKKALRFDSKTLSWELLGEADQVWQSQQRAEITKLLRDEARSMRPAEIADLLDKSRAAVRKTLSRMVRDNQIAWTAGGFYELKDARSDEEKAEMEQIRKERASVFEQAFKKVYAADPEINDFNWGDLDITDDLLASINRIYGDKQPGSDIAQAELAAPEQAPSEEDTPDNEEALQKAPPECAGVNLKHPESEPPEIRMEDYWKRFRK